MMNYPQYRKYRNGKSYFRILSPTEFEEIQQLGTRWTLHIFVAKILPDRNLIYDMTFDFETHWEKIDSDEFDKILSQA
jgi:hypothetical protein